MQNKSTTDCLFILQPIVKYQLCHKRKLYCAFIDFQKAFDHIYKNGIWYKLGETGLSFKLKNTCNVFNDNILLVQDKLKLFDSAILPILMYGSEIWGFCRRDDIESVHFRF